MTDNCKNQAGLAVVTGASIGIGYESVARTN